MSLSISNSKMKFSVGLFSGLVALLLAYHFAIPIVANIPTEYQNQNQDNAIKIEGFVFGNQSKEVVIVGSSLAARLDQDLQGKYNLALGGESALTGLEVIRRSGIAPKVVFIEGNVLLPTNEELVNTSLGQPLYFLKNSSPIFREKYQPVTVLNSVIKSFFSRKPKAFNKEGFEIGLKEQIKGHHEVTETAKQAWATRLAELGKYIDDLKNQNVEVAFIYMPMHADVYEAPLSVYQREELTSFLKNKSIAMILPDSLNYQTTDGIHLDLDSVGLFTKYLEGQIAKFGY